MSARGTQRQLLRDIGTFADLGFRFALAVAVGSFVGYWVDEKLNTSPLFIVIGVLLGATSGFLTLYRAVYSDTKSKDNNKSKSS